MPSAEGRRSLSVADPVTCGSSSGETKGNPGKAQLVELQPTPVKRPYPCVQQFSDPVGASSMADKHLLHVFPSFGLGGVPIRIATIVNFLGDACRHTILALDGNFDSQVRIEPGIQVDYERPAATRYGLWRNIRENRRVIAGLAPDLLLTYNWGAIEWALANGVRPLARHIHFESGFGIEEAERLLMRRVIFRRFALRRTELLVVPSQKLVQIASERWKLPGRKIKHIPNGVDVGRYAGVDHLDAALDFASSRDEIVIGTLSPLRPEKNLARLIRAFARLSSDRPLRLMIVGDGPERARLETLARELGVSDRTTFTGHVEAIEGLLSSFDVFSLSSDTEQMPNSLLQAMASGCAVAAVDVGDVKQMVSPPNRSLIVPKSDADLAASFERLLADAELRGRLGRANQAHVREHYSAERMYAAYAKVLGLSP